MKNIFVAILTYKKPLDEVVKFRPAHLDFLDEYYNAGKFIVSGRQTPPVGGVIEFTPAKYAEKFENFVK